MKLRISFIVLNHKESNRISVSSLDEVDWRDDCIIVMGKVTISPPYRPDNVKGVSDSKAVMHVRKIVSEL